MTHPNTDPSASAAEVSDAPAPRPASTPRTVLHLTEGIDLRVEAHPMNAAGGSRDWYTVTTAGGAVGVVVVARRGHRVLVGRHWRLATGAAELELPRGSGEPGETPAQAALRELHEETGLSASTAREVGRFRPDSGLLTNEVAVVLCEGFDATAQPADGEFDQLAWLDAEQLYALAASGELTDGMSLCALMLARPHLLA